MTARDLGKFNWFGDIQCFEAGPERPASERDVVAILRDAGRYPSPLRPMGSRHSMTPCMAAFGAGRWGTGIDMTAFTGEIRVDRERATATVPAGLTFYEAAHQLKGYGLQFRVNTELGTLTMGAAACGATKDSSFPGEPGQVCHDVVGMRLVRPDGEVCEVTHDDPDFEALRCSYGLFGVVTAVTFRVFPHQYIAIEHREVPLARFETLTGEWLSNNALFLYLFPYAKQPHVMAELRRKEGALSGDERSFRLEARNYFWRKGLHKAADAAQRMPGPLGELLGELEQKLVREFMEVVKKRSIDPVAQIVNFAKGAEEFTFSMWAFKAGEFPGILPEYIAFCRKHEQDHKFRTVLPHVSYHISKDTSSLLSYSYDTDVWTLDPIASGCEPGWKHFLGEFNAWCSKKGGKPLFNQSPLLTRAHVVRAFGDRLARFEQARRRFDPGNRMLNDYFANLLAD